MSRRAFRRLTAILTGLALAACQRAETRSEGERAPSPVETVEAVGATPALDDYCARICERSAECRAELSANGRKPEPATPPPSAMGGEELRKCVALCAADVPANAEEWALLRRARSCLDESSCGAFTDCFSKVPAAE